jgi:hypothetical protein
MKSIVKNWESLEIDAKTSSVNVIVSSGLRNDCLSCSESMSLPSCIN